MTPLLSSLDKVVAGEGLSGVRPELAFDVPSDLRAVEATVEYVTRHCEECTSEIRRLRHNLSIALTEAIANAVLYGNLHDPHKSVRVEVYLKNRMIAVRVTDQGEGFDPSLVPDPTAPENRLRCSGRGLFLMRSLVDEVRYNARGNSVLLVLYRRRGMLEGGARA